MVNEKIVNQLAGKFVKSGIAFEDLKSEAIVFALEAIEKYDPKFGTSIDTWQWKCIYEGLKCSVSREWDWQNHRFNSNVANPNCQLRNHSFLQNNEIDDNDRDFVDTFTTKEQGHAAFEITASLSKEAKMVCSAIFSAPGEYMSLMPKMARGKLVKKFRGEGWSWPQIWRVFNEIKSALS